MSLFRDKQVQSLTVIVWIILTLGCSTFHGTEQKKHESNQTPPPGIEKATEYWKNGSLKTDYTYYRKNGTKVLHGTLNSYNQSGSLYLKEEYVQGRLDGERILYDENGRRKLIERYRNGHLHGTTTVYEFGRKVREAEFEEGVFRRATRWDRVGRIRVQFENDTQGRIFHGTSYDEDGNVTGRVEEGTGRLVLPLGDEKVRVIVAFEKGQKVSEELVGETGEDFDFVDPITPFSQE